MDKTKLDLEIGRFTKEALDREEELNVLRRQYLVMKGALDAEQLASKKAFDVLIQFNQFLWDFTKAVLSSSLGDDKQYRLLEDWYKSVANQIKELGGAQ